MKELIAGLFQLLAVLFDKIPLLNKLKGYRTVLGLVGLAVVTALQISGVGSADVLQALQLGFTGLSALALNAKNNGN